jgi:2-methylcitrate dehydratase PrpD
MAANVAAGLSEAVKVGTSEYHFTYAHAGVNGYMAAALARAGGVAAPTAFEGDGGFYQLFGAVSRDKLHEYDSAGDVLGRLGSSWQIQEMIYKPYPIYFFNSSLVDGARMIREQDGFDPGEIRSVKVGIGSLAMASGGPNLPPFRNRDSVLGASAFCVGSMLSRGSLSLKDTQDIDAPDILTIIDKTEVEANDGLMTARIEVQTAGGTFTYDSETEGRDYRLPEADIHQIFLDAASNTLAEDHCRELLVLLDHIEELDDVARLVAATGPADAA